MFVDKVSESSQHTRSYSRDCGSLVNALESHSFELLFFCALLGSFENAHSREFIYAIYITAADHEAPMNLS